MFFRWMVPVCPGAEGGSEEHPRGSIGCPRGPILEPWRPVLLLLPLAEGPSRGHTAAVCQEERTRPEVVKPVHDFDCEGKGIWMTRSPFCCVPGTALFSGAEQVDTAGDTLRLPWQHIPSRGWAGSGCWRGLGSKNRDTHRALYHLCPVNLGEILPSEKANLLFCICWKSTLNHMFCVGKETGSHSFQIKAIWSDHLWGHFIMFHPNILLFCRSCWRQLGWKYGEDRSLLMMSHWDQERVDDITTLLTWTWTSLRIIFLEELTFVVWSCGLKQSDTFYFSAHTHLFFVRLIKHQTQRQETGELNSFDLQSSAEEPFILPFI